MDPLGLLRQYFGYDTFRSPQEAVIRRLLTGQHALVIMSTGAGKSLCYQIPALASLHAQLKTTGKPPLTLVLSPLIALMKDQVDALKSRNIPATFINSSLSRGERQRRYAAVASGEYLLLYVTPERFRKPEFLDAIARRQIELLAVDEAHCISECVAVKLGVGVTLEPGVPLPVALGVAVTLGVTVTLGVADTSSEVVGVTEGSGVELGGVGAGATKVFIMVGVRIIPTDL